MRRVSLRAVVLGFLVELFLDILVGIIFLVLSWGTIFVTGRSGEQVSQALLALTKDPSILLASAILGTLTTVVGGYVAARLSKSSPYLNGLVLGLVYMLYGVLVWSNFPIWLDLYSLVVVIPATLLGAHIAVRRGVALT